MKAVLAIDIDGTVMPFVFPRVAEPYPGFKEFTHWAKKYFHLHFFSTRFNPEVHGWSEARKEMRRMRDWFITHEIHFDHMSPYKPPAICFIDDRAFQFNMNIRYPLEMDWDRIKEQIQIQFGEYIEEVSKDK